MNRLQAHRGPDGEGLWIHPRGHVGFGHRRLSIIDLATGQQPMSDSSGNWITFNGEIYNYRELRIEVGGSNISQQPLTRKSFFMLTENGDRTVWAIFEECSHLH